MPARSHARQESARSHASQVMPARSQSTRSHANQLVMPAGARPRCLFCRVEPVPVGIDKGRLLMSGDHFFSSTQGLWASRHCARAVERRHPGGWRCASKRRLVMSQDCFFSSTQGLWASRHCARTVEHATTRAGAGALQFDARPSGVPSLCPDGRTRRHPGGCRCASRGRLLMSGDNS